MHINKHGGYTYFERWGFSINEGQFPNIHMQWGRGQFFFYLALGRKFRWSFGFLLAFEMKRLR